MITSPVFAGKRYAVLGLARSGVATVEALLASGAGVVAWDSDEGKRNSILPGTGRGTSEAGGGAPSAAYDSSANPDVPLHHAAHGPPPRAGEDIVLADPMEIELAGFDAVVVSPGVPLNKHPIAARAREAGVPIIGDIELFAQARASLPPHKVVGITGTNGKSTTTALVAHICRTAGLPTLMGGNIGLPILAQDPLEPNGAGDPVYVLELSSYQIDLTFSLDCDVAVLLNITPDHLDRYDGFAAYAASKARLFKMSSGVAVIATEDAETKRIASSLRHAGLDPASRFSSDQGSGAPAQGRGDVVEVKSANVPPQSEWPALQGPHNAQNAVVAIAVAEALGIDRRAVLEAMQSYPGLPHRMERVAEKNGVLFVNDSKATNATAAAPALAAYPVIHWILGGRAKTDELDDCAPHFDHVKAGYTIGEAGPLFTRILKDAGKPVTESGTLAEAVRDAAAAALPGEVVMLSPACASFDQFRDFEARGEAFRAAVEAL